jgi:hypothetical protein
MPTLDTLRWTPRWTSHLGCLEGCLDYLGLPISEAWLFGGTGQAFAINIAPGVCPSGPTAWNTERIYALGANLGYETQVTFALRRSADFEVKQRHGWDRVRHAIDSGLPCFGWELKIPEYYVIHGYHETGYLFKGPLCEAGGGPRAWREVGATEIGVLELVVVNKASAAEEHRVVKEALEFALALNETPERWTLDRSRLGLAAYSAWIEAVAANEALGVGMAYNAAVWSECRRMAVGFLREAKGRLSARGGLSFDAAIGHYNGVAGHLEAVANMFPFLSTSEEDRDRNVRDPARLAMAREHLDGARRAEESGLLALAEIVALL